MKSGHLIAGVLLLFAVQCASAQGPSDLGGPEVEAWPIPAPSEELPLPAWQDNIEEESLPLSTPESDRIRESTWYLRMDYFHWNERIRRANLLNESGPLWTLGYQRRDGRERFRGEFFAGVVGYKSRIDYWDGTSEPLVSRTNYMGVKGEYDLLMESTRFPTLNWYGGIGTRFWIRDLPDDFTPSGTFVSGYQESWWTVYPYLGVERRRIAPNGREFYWSGRVGFTPLTYVHGTFVDSRLYPTPSILGAFEVGVRHQQMFFGANLETFNWGQSPEVSGWVQPMSSLVLVGVKAGVNF